MNDFLSVIRNSRLFSGVSEEELTARLSCLGARQMDFPKDSFLLRAGGSVDSIGLILSGTVMILQEDIWGNRNILSKLGPGQTYAVSFACVPGSAINVSVLAQTEVTVLTMNVGRILTMCPSNCSHHSLVLRNLLEDLACKNLRLNEKLTHMGQRTTRAKLMSYLSAEAQHHNSLEFDIPFDRQQLADYLCIERSAMSTELSRLQKDGLLQTERYHFRLIAPLPGTLGR